MFRNLGLPSNGPCRGAMMLAAGYFIGGHTFVFLASCFCHSGRRRAPFYYTFTYGRAPASLFLRHSELAFNSGHCTYSHQRLLPA